jgi:capsular polysaccharide biosynthesis protein
LLGLAIGLVVGVAYGIIFELANTHVVSSKEIEQMTGVKVIGNIPDLTPETEERARKGHKGGHL